MFLLYVYAASFILGGIFLGASLFLGHHDANSKRPTDAEADAHLEADSPARAMAETDAANIEGSHGAELSDFWLAFLSVRFWVYFLCLFGLTGTIFTILALAGKWPTLGASVSVGTITSFAAAFLIQKWR
jgi:hypothetical protein